MKSQSNNKKARTDFVNSIVEKTLTPAQIKHLWKNQKHHYSVGTPAGVWSTRQEKIIKSTSPIVDFTTRKQKFYRTYDHITLIDNIKGNLVLSQYRVTFLYNRETMLVRCHSYDVIDINVWFKDKSKRFVYSRTSGWNALTEKFTERSAYTYYVDHDIHQEPYNIRNSVFKNTKWKYLDMVGLIKNQYLNFASILRFHNLPLLEKAQKEGWARIARDTVSGKSIPAQFRLPRFSKKEIWEMIDFYKDKPEFNLDIYRDYIELGYKLKKTFGPQRYLVDNYQELHDRYVNEQRRIDIKLRKTQEGKRIAAQKWWKKNAKDIKAKDIKVNKIKSPKDLKEFGGFMGNCMGVIEKDWKDDYAIQIKDEWVAVKYVPKKDYWQILGYKNLSLPKIIIPKIKNKVIRFANA